MHISTKNISQIYFSNCTTAKRKTEQHKTSLGLLCFVFRFALNFLSFALFKSLIFVYIIFVIFVLHLTLSFIHSVYIFIIVSVDSSIDKNTKNKHFLSFSIFCFVFVVFVCNHISFVVRFAVSVYASSVSTLVFAFPKFLFFISLLLFGLETHSLCCFSSIF